MNKKQSKRVNKNTFANFQSEDTEGSDISYQSSEENEDQETVKYDKEKNIQIFKEEMARFFISNPQLKAIKFDDQKPHEPQSLWSTITANVLKQSKSMQLTPSIQSFTKRLNLYRNKLQRYDLIDLILRQEKKLLSQIEADIANKKKNLLSIHQRAEEKVRKQTGSLNYISKTKKQQFKKKVVNEQQSYKNNGDIGSLQKQKQLREKNVHHIHSSEKLETKLSMFESEFKSEAGKALLQSIKKKDQDSAKIQLIKELSKHRQKTKQEFKSKQSLLQQGYRYYPEDSKQFMLLYPNPNNKKKNGGQISQDLHEVKKDLESGNTYLLQKINKVLNGDLIKHWKAMHERKI